MKNKLNLEKSPYLKQHAENPVWWYPWGAEAFEKAERENKLIFLSIGYSTCHWCHVMEHESFTQQDVADILNQNFISIKVDREERPDVDSVYMNIMLGLNGHGGWPLNMVLTPKREAFFCGTYYPRANFVHLLNEIQSVWHESPEQILSTGGRIAEWLRLKDVDSEVGSLGPEIFKTFYTGFLKSFDFENGGRLGAPKFIPSYGLRLLLRYQLRAPDSQALALVEKTLEMVSRGGIYDHLGGGFHRYATDEAWLIPHFEKMLYDQSAMANIFLEAYQLTENTEYKMVLQETLEYVLRDLQAPEGGFYSAEDADSEGEEGSFYLWTFSEIERALTAEELHEFKLTYNISLNGNFENKNILELAPGKLRQNFSAKTISAQDKLFARRLSRPRPLRDEKILVSWNGLMISALAKAGACLKETTYVKAAKRAADFIIANLKNTESELYHQSIDGVSSHDAVLEDYAFFIDGLIEIYQTDFEEKYLLEAQKLQKKQDEIFLSSESQSYFSSSGRDIYLIKREKSFLDNVTPSGNSMTLFNLLRLADFFFDSEMSGRAQKLLNSFPKEIQAHPSEFVQALMAYDYLQSTPKQIAILWPETSAQVENMLDVVREGFHPHQILGAGSVSSTDLALLMNRKLIDGKPTAYVCEHHSCQLPTTELHELKKLIV